MDTRDIHPKSEIREWEYPLTEKRMDPNVEAAIVNKATTRFLELWRYWGSRLEAGEENWNALVGVTLTAREREYYEKQRKIILEIPELVPKINALEGMQISSRREGTVIASGPEDAAPASIVKHILREDIHRKNGIEQELTRCFTDAIVSSFPQALWFDRVDPLENRGKKLDVFHGQWNDTLYDNKFSRMDYSDAQDIIRVRTMTRDTMVAAFPKLEKRINEVFPEGSSFDSLSLASFANMDSADERSEVVRRLSYMLSQYAQSGLLYVIEWMKFVHKVTEVWVSPYSTEVEILPPEWGPEETAAWRASHPEYSPVKKKVRILWVTTVSPGGIVLENKPHWYQEGEFPCEVYIPRMWNNKIYGVVEFLKGSLRGRNVTKMETLHSLRMANDNLMIVKEGALVNSGDAAVEKGRAGGVLVLRRFAQMSDVEFPLNQRENSGWRDMSESFLMDIDRLSVDRNFEGGTQASQESGRAIGIRIAQTQNKHLAYLTSFAQFNLRVNRKAVSMIPYLWNEPEIYRYIDPDHPEEGAQEVELNMPEDFNIMTGAVTKVKNNLEGAKYDYVEAEGDNSPSAKAIEMAEFQGVLQSLAPIQDVSLWPDLLLSMPNSIAQKFGRALQQKFAEQAQAAAAAGDETPNPAPARVSLSIKGDQLQDPTVIDVLREMKVMPDAPGVPGSGGMDPGGMDPGGLVEPGAEPSMAGGGIEEALAQILGSGAEIG